MDLTGAVWRKSTRSGDNGGACVEVAVQHHVVAVRDSKDPTGPVLMLSSADWRTFTGAVKHRRHASL